LSVLYFQQHDPLRFPVRFAVFPVRFLARSFVFNKIARFVFKKRIFLSHFLLAAKRFRLDLQ